MKSKDIARYVARLEEALDHADHRLQVHLTDEASAQALLDRVIDQRNKAEDRRDKLAVETTNLKAEVERLRARIKDRDDRWEGLQGVLHGLADEIGMGRTTSHDGISFRALDHEVRDRIVERLRAALPVLPDVGPVTRLTSGVLSISVGPNEYRWHDAQIGLHEESALEELAAVKACRAFLDTEAADTTPDTSRIEFVPDMWAALTAGSKPAPVAADTTPDTSRVTFGTRHEGTGMVLLQHADAIFPDTVYGDHATDTVKWHRSCVRNQRIDARSRFIHAALSEVREALNTAEADGVDVRGAGGRALCSTSSALSDVPQHRASQRARRYLAREVQALVDQGLRGDDLNARVPYEVRDHRAPVEAADTSSDDEGAVVAGVLRSVYAIPENPEGAAAAILDALTAHRAARTSKEAGQ